jgi:hypothetical protein
MTEPNKANEYHEKQYPAQRLRFFIRKVTDIKENFPPEQFDEQILILKNEFIEDVELINQAVERVGK